MAQMRDTHEARLMAVLGQATTFKKFTNVLGAGLSVALMLGVGVWGYKLLVRDVSGVPVIRAAAGPMRVQPDDPGGQQTAHQGLSVNTVAALGEAADPVDRLVLAPAPLELSLDDAPAVQVTPLAEADEVMPTGTEAETTSDEASVQLAVAQALAGDLAANIAPLPELTPKPEPEPEAAVVTPQTPKVEGGLGKSLRPQIRPASLITVAATAAPPDEITAANIPAGTYLAQLGAFESADVARSEWGRLSRKFGAYLDGKDRVIQKTESGGRIFYRLRAMGFNDLDDARRFCSAMIAEGAKCISVVTR